LPDIFSSLNDKCNARGEIMLTLHPNQLVAIIVGLAAVCSCAVASAQSAPGEDPIQLHNKVSIQMLPLGGPPKSGSLNFATDMPNWQKAKISRYEAKAFSANTEGILTEKDVVNTASSDGFKTTCTQSIGSTSGNTGPGVKPAQQVVVLRGDLVNICN
jgi:hypothetical protein